MSDRVYKIFVLTVSDGCYSDLRVDKSGHMLKDLASNFFLYKNIPFTCSTKIVPDETLIIEEELIKRIDVENYDLVLTTGGTGLSERDHTPEATRRVITKEATGISTLMLIHGLKFTPLAALSRSVCGVRKQSLIINLPGSLRAVKEGFDAVSSVLIHALDLLRDIHPSIDSTHFELSSVASSKPETENQCIHRTIAEKDSRSNSQDIAYSNSRSPSLSTETETISDFQYRKRPFQIKEAMSIIFNEILSITKEFLEYEILDTHNLVCASNLLSPVNIPEVNISAMDGYAVIAPIMKDDKLKCGDRIYSGANCTSDILVGKCAYVSTGSVIPPSANSVIPIECVEILPDQSIRIVEDFPAGKFIRLPGSDVQKSQCVIKAGECLTSAHIALAASLGFKKLMCYRPTSIGILSTGNEIKSIAHQKQYFEAYDVNSIILTQEIKSKKLGKLTDYGIVADQFELLKNKLRHIIEENDVIITTGGVSVGEKDYVRSVLMEMGAQIFFEKVNLKPGKPTCFASMINEKGKNVLFFCLPGNPVSCFVTFKVFVLPALAQLCKMKLPPQINVRMGKKIALTDSRPEYIRVNFVDTNQPVSNYTVIPMAGDGCSSRLMSVCGCDAIVLLPGKTESIGEVDEGAILPAIIMT